MAAIVIHIDLNIGKRGVRAFLTLACLLSAASELSSESVTLTTYYPAPSGVYTQMITTNNTYLSRDGGETIVGPVVAAVAGVKLVVTGGNTGIGTNNPTNLLSVTGTADVTRLGVGTTAPSQPLEVAGNSYLRSGTVGINTAPAAAWTLQVSPFGGLDKGNVGISGGMSVAANTVLGAFAVPPAGGPTLDVRTGSVKITNPACAARAYAPNGFTPCGTSYATLIPGVWSPQPIILMDNNKGAGTMYCCN